MFNGNGSGRRIVVTGLGAVTPLGRDVRTFWENTVAGKNAIGPITRFKTETYQTKMAAEVRDFDPAQHFELKEIKKLDLFVQYAMVAAREALRDSGLDFNQTDPNEVGVYIGSGIGGIQIVEGQKEVLDQKGNTRVTPFLIPKMIPNMASGMVSIDLGAKGPNACIVTACAAGTHSIGEAAHLILRGDAVAMICGGAESCISPLSIAGFANMHALSRNNDNMETASRPFDKERDGFVMGEGAGVLVLEELQHARARGARIYCEIAGYGLSGDAFHMTAPAPCGEGGARALKKCLASGRINPDAVDYINAHGTSTPLNDKLETEAIKTVLGEHAKKIAVSSNKSMIGHLIGAAGAVEAISTVLTIRDSVIPPTINYRTPDPECDLDYVPNTARQATVNLAVSNSLGFGGHNCSIALRKFRG